MNPTANLLTTALRRADAGELAALRRATFHAPPTAFFRLTAHLLDADGPARDVLENKWLVICAVLAQKIDLVRTLPLGAAMAFAKVSEMRLLRLLQSHDEPLFDQLRAVVHHLVSRGQEFGADDVTELVISDGDDRRGSDGISREDRIRRKVARDYYRNQKGNP